MFLKNRLLLFLGLTLSGAICIAKPVSDIKKTADITYEKITEVELKDMLKMYQTDLFIKGAVRQEKWIQELEITIKSEGFFELNKSQKNGFLIDWNIVKPEPLHVCIEGTKILIKDKQQETPIEQDFNNASSQGQYSLSTLKALMEMDIQKLQKDFVFTKKRTHELLLKNDKLSVEILINNKKLIQQVKFIEMSGDVLKIEFIDIKKILTLDKFKKCTSRI